MAQGEDAFSRLVKCLGISQPYEWQSLAFQRLTQGDVPETIVVPTAAGKTMFIAAFVAALAAQAMSGQAVTLPRKLVHVVNRRVLVDEATRLTQSLCRALNEDPALGDLRQALASLSATGQPLMVVTLRGGLKDDASWCNDPSTPTLILATPDMLGSRLLFRGYGLGRSRAATQAGLLGCDTLVVHDEAHLAPSFSALLRQVEAAARPGALRLGRPPLQVVEMTATLGTQGERALVCDVALDDRLKSRMAASKTLRWLNCAEGDSKPDKRVRDTLKAQLVQYRDANRAVAVFVSHPGLADDLARHLIKQGVPADRVLVLTGTLRGHERAALSAQPAFRRFDPGQGRCEDGTAYFIATSAGEIGLDIDADVGVFDLTPLDRFIQRCGRVNRRGLSQGEVLLVHAGGAELPPVLQASATNALRMLQSLPQKMEGVADVSPLALHVLTRQPGYTQAVLSPPPQRRLEPEVLALLTMTSLPLHELQCPAPSVYIQGLVDEESVVSLAWRHLPAPHADLEQWLEVCPLLPDEIATQPDRATKKLLVERIDTAIHQLPAQARTGWCAVVLDAQGVPLFAQSWAQVAESTAWVWRLKNGQTVLLDVAVGGLSPQGLPSPDAPAYVSDVSTLIRQEPRATGALERVVHQMRADTHESGWVWSIVADDLSGEGAWEGLQPEECLAKAHAGWTLLFHDAPRHIAAAGWQGTVQVWLSEPQTRPADAEDWSSLGTCDRPLQQHLDLAAHAASCLAHSLGLQADIGADLGASAWEHDRGKAWARWQRAIGNTDLDHPLGKSVAQRFDHRLNDGYRHELGSLLEMHASTPVLQTHLVGTHHGWGRPSYRATALDKPGCAAAAWAVTQGFDALNQSLGSWAVAHLEAILKAADVLAETHASQWLPMLTAPNQIGPTCSSVRPWTVPRVVAEHVVRVSVDVQNFGEYLAVLGLLALFHRQNHVVTLDWGVDHACFYGVNDTDLAQVLNWLCQARVEPDAPATRANVAADPYPPLKLQWPDGQHWPLNHWMDERLADASGWKLGAGQTSAKKTLDSLFISCSRALQHPQWSPLSLLEFGGRWVRADASKFRFDAATNWSAQDAGFSLNESEAFKSTRPWVELLSALGLQFYFLPPADQVRRYFVWRGPISPTLALAAVKGLLPVCTQGYEPQFVPSGKMKDVYTAKPIYRERNTVCPSVIRLI